MARVVGVEAVLPVIWAVGNAGLVGANARGAGKHVEGLVLVGATPDAGVVGAQARLPVHGVVGDASLVVGGAGGARGEGDSVLVPGARASA